MSSFNPEHFFIKSNWLVIIKPNRFLIIKPNHFIIKCYCYFIIMPFKAFNVFYRYNQSIHVLATDINDLF